MRELLLKSALLPVPHGFSTRAGGVSTGPFAELNLSFSVGDEPANVEENLRRAAGVAGVDPAALFTVSQVHGDRVLEVGQGDDRPPAPGEADALWTARARVSVGVRTADCVPILLADPVGKRVAAVHSGWRGTVARVAARTVEALTRAGSRQGDLLAAIGPSIRCCCYPVSAEVAGQFQTFGPGVVIEEGGALHLDLAQAVRRTLVESGVGEERIELLPDCTSCDQASFYSHRRDRGVTGRHLSFITCRF